MISRPRVVLCPTCGTRVPWTPENKWRPFCSERCKLVDLGSWATEKYRVPVAEQDDSPQDAQPGETPGQDRDR